MIPFFTAFARSYKTCHLPRYSERLAFFLVSFLSLSFGCWQKPGHAFPDTRFSRLFPEDSTPHIFHVASCWPPLSRSAWFLALSLKRTGFLAAVSPSPLSWNYWDFQLASLLFFSQMLIIIIIIVSTLSLLDSFLNSFIGQTKHPKEGSSISPVT